MDMRRLAAFVRIVETGSISRAAEEFGVAQPALSQQLAVLERELAAKLFERSRRGVTATPAGRALYSRANIVLRLVNEFGDVTKRASEDLSGIVPVGLLPSVANKIGLPLLKALRSSHPHIQLQLNVTGEAELTQQLQDGRSDMAVMSQRPTHGDLTARKLVAERLVALASPKTSKGFASDVSKFAALPWISTRKGHSVRRIVDAALAREGLTANVVAEIDSLEILMSAVEAGLGVAVLPLGAVPARARLRIEPFFDLTRSLYICRRTALTPAAEEVFAVLGETAKIMTVDEQKRSRT
jgi:DNA-binding transcriptional LysR family regulator